MPVIVEIPGLAKFQGDIAAASAEMQVAVAAAMTDSVNTVMVKARALAPYKTGTLRRSIYSKVTEGGLRGLIAQDVNIAKYGSMMEFGTAPHDIYPVTAKALHWGNVFAKHVFHPGTAPRPFMMPALQQSTDQIVAYFQVAIGKVVLRMSGKL